MTRRDAGLLLAGLVALAAVGYLVGILVTRVFDGFFLGSIDRPAIDWLAEHRSPFWNSFMRAATHVGAGAVVIALTIAAAVLAHVTTRDPRWTSFIALAGLGGVFLDKVLKPLVGRERPDFDRLIEIGGPSFPSGHATAVTGLWLALAFFLHLRWGRRAAPIWPVAIGLIVLVVVTRPYLGVHYPTDVVAGAVLSAVWVVLCLRVIRSSPGPPGSPEE